MCIAFPGRVVAVEEADAIVGSAVPRSGCAPTSSSAIGCWSVPAASCVDWTLAKPQRSACSSSPPCHQEEPDEDAPLGRAPCARHRRDQRRLHLRERPCRQAAARSCRLHDAQERRRGAVPGWPCPGDRATRGRARRPATLLGLAGSDRDHRRQRPVSAVLHRPRPGERPVRRVHPQDAVHLGRPARGAAPRRAPRVCAARGAGGAARRPGADPSPRLA